MPGSTVGTPAETVAEQMSISPDQIGDTDHLMNDIGCDSLDVIEITMKAEVAYGISLPEEAADVPMTVGALTDAITPLLEVGGSV